MSSTVKNRLILLPFPKEIEVRASLATGHRESLFACPINAAGLVPAVGARRGERKAAAMEYTAAGEINDKVGHPHHPLAGLVRQLARTT